MKINLPLFALAVGAFAIGTTEFAPMGFLPEIAEGVSVPIPQAGLLISAYAIGVMLGAPIMTIFLARFSKRNALIFLMVLFTFGNVLAALAPNYIGLMTARVITSLNHGAFFGLGAVVAASLVEKNNQSSAVAMMFMGLTIANIIGVPISTSIGQNIGWRVSFGFISILGLVSMIFLWRYLPNQQNISKHNFVEELKVLSRLPVIFALLTTVLSAGAMFTLYTYIAPSLKSFTHASPTFITMMLVVIGVGFSIGNHLGGKLADIALEKTLIGFLILMMLSMLFFPVLASTGLGATIALLVWGISAFAIVPPLQTHVMALSEDAPTLASSVNIAAFNLGNAVGAILGALVLNTSMNYEYVSYIGSFLCLSALLLVVMNLKFKFSNKNSIT